MFFLQRHSTGAVLPKVNNLNNRHSSGASAAVAAAAALKTWQCPACTYENSSASVVCDICSSPRGLVTSMTTDGGTSTGVAASIVDASRKESKLMEYLRKIEESEARTKWENIIQYCKEVCVIDVTQIYIDRISFVPIHFAE